MRPLGTTRRLMSGHAMRARALGLLLLPAMAGLFTAPLAHAQQFDFAGPFGRTVAPETGFIEEAEEVAPPSGDIAEVQVTGASVREPQVQWLLVPTIITADDLKVYALSAGAAFGPNQLMVRYSNIDPQGADSSNQYFAQYKRTLTRNMGVFGFASRNENTRSDYGAAATFGAAIGESVEVAANAGWQLRNNDEGADEDDFLARAGVLWKPQKWLQVALDYELENNINDADTTSIEVTLLDKLFVGADSEHTYWGGFSFVF